AFLAALNILANAQGNYQHTDRWRHDSHIQVLISARSPLGTVSVGDGPNQFPPSVVEDITPHILLHLPSQGVSMQSTGQNDDKGPPFIRANGEGVPTLLDYLLRRDRQ